MNHALFARALAEPGAFHGTPGGAPDSLSTGVSVELYDCIFPKWHASIAWWDEQGRRIHPGTWPTGRKRAARRQLLALYRGRGEGRIEVFEEGTLMHARRRLNAWELARMGGERRAGA